jgi:hypothetical protein
LHFGELLEIFHQRTRDVVEGAVGLAAACQVDVCNAISKGQSAITREAVQDERESLIPLDITGSFEELIEHRAQKIDVGRDKARHGDLIRKLPADQTIVIGEVDIDLHI